MSMFSMGPDAVQDLRFAIIPYFTMSSDGIMEYKKISVLKFETLHNALVCLTIITSKYVISWQIN